MKEGWKYVKLQDCCNIIGGGTPSKKKEEYYKGDIPWASVRDMNVDFLTATEFSITEDALKDSSSNLIPANEVIIATRVGLGKVCVLAQDTAINQDLKGIVPKQNEKINRKFLFYWFRSLSNYIVSNGVGATVQGVKLDFVKDLRFPIIPLSEQQQIVDFLDAEFAKIDELKNQAEQSLQNAKDLFQAALKKMLTPKQGWKKILLGNICSKISDGSHNPPNGVDSSEYLMLSSKNVRNDLFTFDSPRFLTKEDFDKENQRTDVEKEDVLLTIVGAGLGECCVYPSDKKIVFQRSVAVLKPNKELTSGRFLMYLLQSLYENLRKESNGAAQKGIYLKQLKNYEIVIPSSTEQANITEQLDEISKKTKQLQTNYTRTIQLCADLKQALLRQVFE